MSIQHRHAFVADAECAAGLRSLGNFKIVLAFQSGYANFSAHRRLRYRQRDDAVQIVPFSYKKRMLLHMQHNVEVARGAAAGASFASASKAYARAIFHARGNFRIHGALTKNPAFAFAFGAGIGNYAAGSLTRRARSRDAEEALLIAHLPAAGASAAGSGAFTGRRARAATLFAGFVTADHHFRFRAEGGLFKLDAQIFAQISATLNPAPAAAAAATESVTKTEELAKNLAYILERRAIEASAGSAAFPTPAWP